MTRPAGVPDRPQRFQGGGGHCEVSIERHRIGDFFDLAHHRRQVERHARQREPAILPAGDEQQLLDQLRRALELALHRHQGVPDLGLGASLGQGPLDVGTQQGERGAQLVTRVGSEGFERPVRAIDALEHAVDAVGELRHFRLACGAGEALAELRGTDGACLRGHPLERRQGCGDRLARAAFGGKRGEGQQQRGRRRDRCQRDEIRLPARDDVDVEGPRRAVQHAEAPARPLRDRRQQRPADVVRGRARGESREPLRRHPGGQEVHLVHATRAGDDHLPAHPHELLGERGGHHAPRSPRGVGVGAEQRLDHRGGVVEGAAQHAFARHGERRHGEAGVPGERRPGDAPEARDEDRAETALAHGASSR